MVNPYRNQIEQQVLCAEPLELVVMLYSELRGSIRDARRLLATGDIVGRARSVSKAMAIVGELANSLDLSRGGDLAAGLHRLYAFLATQLLDGNYRQVDQPLAEAEAVTDKLLEAWSEVRPAAPSVFETASYGEVGESAEMASLSVCG